MSTTPRERWKAVKGFEGLYEVSNLGRVRAVGGTTKGRWKPFPYLLKPRRQSEGYTGVTLRENGRGEFRYIQQLVAEAFLPKRPSARHRIFRRNEDRADNRATNLRWGLPPWGTKDGKKPANTPPRKG